MHPVEQLIAGELHSIWRAPHDYIFRTVDGKFIYYDLDTDCGWVENTESLKAEIGKYEAPFDYTNAGWEILTPLINAEFDAQLCRMLAAQELWNGTLYQLVNGHLILLNGYEGIFFESLQEALNNAIDIAASLNE